MKLERTVLWAEKDLFLEDGDPAIGFLGFLRGCFCESGLQTDENLPETVRAEYAEVLHFLCSPDARRILCGKVQMEGYCRNRRKSHVPMAFGRECWGFRILNENLAWYLACTPWNDRRQFSLFVYDRMTLMTALAARVGLPERCYGVQPFMGERILIRYGEDSYELFPQYGCNATENRKYATERNREFCVTLAQVAAMENGSVYGWDTPMADVRNYDKDGHYFPMEEQKGEKEALSEEIYFEPCRLSAEESLCLTDRNETPEMGCIGHLCGDFGGCGKAFHSRWSDHLCADRNDELFKAVFGKLIDTLREKDNLLSCRTALYNNCISHPEWEEKRTDSRRFWKFRYLTRDYAFYFRCTPNLGEDNFCVYAYDREKLFARMAKERGLPLYCYGYLPTTNEVIRIDFGEMGYCPIKVMKTGRSEAAEMNREIGVTPAQAEAMKAGSMFGWTVPAAFPERYDEIGRAKREREVR